MSQNGLFGVGSLARYEITTKVGEGTYGYVYQARDKGSNEAVALKRLIFHKEAAGFPLCAVREIKFLKSLSHKNIVKLKDIVSSKGCEHLDTPVDPESKAKSKEDEQNNVVQRCGNLYLVFEYIEHDLGGLIDAKHKFSLRSIKCIMKQLFEALEFLNEKKIIHRDIKCSNILLSNQHHLKLADFGLARSYVGMDGREGRIDLTNNVVTMWYRSPELLLGSVRYTSSVDMWSAGCVLAELELGKPIFPGKSEIEQWDFICKICGSPSPETWHGMNSLPNYDEMTNHAIKYTNTLRNTYSQRLSDVSIQLLERVLVFDPSRRTSPRIALSHAFFLTAPYPPSDPTELEPLMANGTSLHEYETKLRRKQGLSVTESTAPATAASAIDNSNSGKEAKIIEVIGTLF